MSKQSKFWDETLKPKLQEVHKAFEGIDGVSQHYIGSAMFYVEHDLADDRDPRFRILQVQGTFSDQGFLALWKEHPELQKKIQDVCPLIKEFMGIENE